MKHTVTFKPMTLAQVEQVKDWLKNDPEHQTADDRIFSEAVPGRSQFAVEHNDETIFYVTVENVARVHIQFNPKGASIKNAKSLIVGFTYLMELLKSRGYWELIFDSKFSALIRFCQKTLGFQKLNDDYSVRF